jgi:hypothetical protein
MWAMTAGDRATLHGSQNLCGPFRASEAPHFGPERLSHESRSAGFGKWASGLRARAEFYLTCQYVKASFRS